MLFLLKVYSLLIDAQYLLQWFLMAGADHYGQRIIKLYWILYVLRELVIISNILHESVVRSWTVTDHDTETSRNDIRSLLCFIFLVLLFLKYSDFCAPIFRQPLQTCQTSSKARRRSPRRSLRRRTWSPRRLRGSWKTMMMVRSLEAWFHPNVLSLTSQLCFTFSEHFYSDTFLMSVENCLFRYIISLCAVSCCISTYVYKTLMMYKTFTLSIHVLLWGFF